MTEDEVPPFRPRAPWWGPDLQTLRNLLRRDQRDQAEGERLLLPLGDGGALAARLDRPAEAAARPLVVTIHGLAGSESSFYMVSTSRYLLSLGFPVLRLNLRGAGPSRATSSGHYHAGKTDDLIDALAALPPDLVRNGLFLVGYSLGGNLVLKYLGEGPVDAPVLAAVSVSAPIDLAAASRRILARRNRAYQHYIVRGLKEEALAEGLPVSREERRAIESARTVVDFDNDFVAPRFGFADAADYYARNSAMAYLPRIRHRTLVIHAFDDPWIPAESYRKVDWSANPAISAVLTRKGGHVGFHGADSKVAWHDRVIGGFCRTV